MVVSEVSLSLGTIYMRMGRGQDSSREMAAYYLKAFRMKKPQHPRPIVIKLPLPPAEGTTSLTNGDRRLQERGRLG